MQNIIYRQMKQCRELGAAAIINGKMVCYGPWNGLNSIGYYDSFSTVLYTNFSRPNAKRDAVKVDDDLIAIQGTNSGRDF